MYTQSGSLVRFDVPGVTFAQMRAQEWEREVALLQLAAQVRSGNAHERSPLQAVLAWARARWTILTSPRRVAQDAHSIA